MHKGLWFTYSQSQNWYVTIFFVKKKVCFHHEISHFHGNLNLCSITTDWNITKLHWNVYVRQRFFLRSCSKEHFVLRKCSTNAPRLHFLRCSWNNDLFVKRDYSQKFMLYVFNFNGKRSCILCSRCYRWYC